MKKRRTRTDRAPRQTRLDDATERKNKALLENLEKEADRMKLKGAARYRAIVAAIYLNILGPVSTVSRVGGLLVLQSRK